MGEDIAKLSLSPVPPLPVAGGPQPLQLRPAGFGGAAGPISPRSGGEGGSGSGSASIGSAAGGGVNPYGTLAAALASGAAAGDDPSARAFFPSSTPPHLFDSPSFTLEALVWALRGTDVAAWRLLSRIHISLLRLLVEDKDATKSAAKKNTTRSGGGDDDDEAVAEGGRLDRTQQVRCFEKPRGEALLEPRTRPPRPPPPQHTLSPSSTSLTTLSGCHFHCLQ